MPIQIINQKLDLQAFKNYVDTFNFGPFPPKKIVLHHTWRPIKENWNGEKSIQGLKRYYEGKGWPAGPHLFVAEDGIWLFSPMNQDGIHAGELNYRSIGIEIVGDYDESKWDGQTKYNAFGTIKILMDKLKIQEKDIHFHNEVSSKTCPGKAITKEWLMNELSNFQFLPRIPSKSARMAAIEKFTAPVHKPQKRETEIMIPISSAEAVTFVRTYDLFEISSQDDVAEAIKFYKFYKLIRKKEI